MNDKTYADGIEDAAKVASFRPWTASEAALFAPHDFDRFERPRQCQRCDYVQHDGSGNGWHPCSVTSNALTNTSEATAIGAGWKLVPIEPTKEMIAAGIDAAEEVEDWTRDTEGSYRIDTPSDAVLPTYRAMLSASPKPDTNTSVEPGVEGVREALDAAHQIGNMTEAEIAAQARYVSELADEIITALATIDHSIARSGMGTGEVSLRESAAVALMYLQTGFMACERCGHEMPTKELDAAHELSGVVQPVPDDWTPAAALSPQQDQSR